MKKFPVLVLYKTKSEYRDTFVFFPTFQLSYDFVSLVEEQINDENITILAKNIISAYVVIADHYPFFENLTDAESYIINFNKIKTYRVISKTDFDSLYNDIVTRIENNKKEVRFKENLKSSLYIVLSENVNGLDTKDYEILSETIKECAKRFDVVIKEDE